MEQSKVYPTWLLHRDPDTDWICVRPVKYVLPNNFDYSDCTDQRCHSDKNDSCRDWRWLGLDGLALDNGHGLAAWMPAQE